MRLSCHLPSCLPCSSHTPRCPFSHMGPLWSHGGGIGPRICFLLSSLESLISWSLMLSHPLDPPHNVCWALGGLQASISPHPAFLLLSLVSFLPHSTLLSPIPLHAPSVPQSRPLLLFTQCPAPPLSLPLSSARKACLLHFSKSSLPLKAQLCSHPYLEAFPEHPGTCQSSKALGSKSVGQNPHSGTRYKPAAVLRTQRWTRWERPLPYSL